MALFLLLEPLIRVPANITNCYASIFRFRFRHLGQVSAVFFGILAYQTGLDALKAFRIDEILMTSILITIWPAKFSLPIGFTAVMLASALHAWQAATDPDFDPTPENPDLPADPS